ncbi:hypothetical protein SAMN02787142_7922 [Burkholderia sp. WP9]|nr:hypothetical protein SAMN02787142_7922 [Burkholderia sp. WP9]
MQKLPGNQAIEQLVFCLHDKVFGPFHSEERTATFK